MSPDDPRHGTNAGAVAHWRAGEKSCQPCREATARLAKQARFDLERGNPRTVVLGEVGHKIIVNTPADQLARATNLTVHKLSRLRKAGPSAVVRRNTRDRIIAAGRSHYWTPIGIQRRVQALHALGWTARQLATEVGIGYEAVKRLTRDGERSFVRREIAESVVATYDRLCMSRAASGRGATRATNAARGRGWMPPLAWDNIDDPAEQPVDWRYVPPTRAEQIRDIHERGDGITAACQQLKTSRKTLEKWCERNGMNRLYSDLVKRDQTEVRNNQHTVGRVA